MSEVKDKRELNTENTTERASSNDAAQLLLKGTTILAAAGIASKILGAIFRIPLTNMIGAKGQSYYSVAYNIYYLLYVLATAGFPVAISRMVSARIAKNDHINAHKSYKLAMKVSVTLGALGFAFLFFGAGAIANAYKIPGAEASIRALSLALLITPLVATLRGYYQGRQQMSSTAITEIVEQFFRVVVGLSLAYSFYKTSLEKAAGGATFGASVGTTAALVVMYVIYIRDKNNRASMFEQSRIIDETDKQRLKELIRFIIPITLGAIVLPLMFNIDSAMVVRRLLASGWDRATAETKFGLMSGFVDPIVSLPNIFIDAICISLMPAVTTAYTLKNQAQLDNHVRTGLKTMMIIATPCTVGLIVLAKPILTMLFYKRMDEAIMAVPLLRILALSIVATAIMRTFLVSLQGIGQMMIPIWNLCIGAVFKAVVSYTLLGVYAINVSGAPIGSIAAYVVAGILNYFALKKHANIKIDAAGVFIKPLLSAAIMGVATMLVYKLSFMIIGSNTLSVFISILAALIVYFITVFKTGAVTKDEIQLMPKGDLIYKFAVKMKIAQ